MVSIAIGETPKHVPNSGQVTHTKKVIVSGTGSVNNFLIELALSRCDVAQEASSSNDCA